MWSWGGSSASSDSAEMSKPFAYVICSVLPFHLARNGPAALETCSSPQKKLRMPSTVPKTRAHV